MGSEIEIAEQRLKSFLGQLQTELAILDRLVYKNKNQHRRCSYFQYLLKVRRDMRLLQSANLEEILTASFQVLDGKRPKQKVQLLESLKRKRSNGGKHNFLARLLGVARLLSQMVEPMLKAATKISTLLAQSFFMGFSLTVLALLARIRVLVQQILLDVVFVFNSVSSLSQKEQAIKLAQDGFEVFREYHPPKQQTISLKCIWDSDKYLLVERQNEKGDSSQEKEVAQDVSINVPKIQYESIEIFLGDEGPGKTASKHSSEDCVDEEPGKTASKHSSVEGQAVMDKDQANSSEGPIQEANDDLQNQVGSISAGPSGNNFVAPEVGELTSISPKWNPAKCKACSKNNVAFVSVNRPTVSTKYGLGFGIHGLEKSDNPGANEENPFLDLLSGENTKNSLF